MFSSPPAFSGLVAGLHTFSVRAIDLAGNTDGTPATRSWTVDTTPPETTLTGARPASVSNDVAPSFSFDASEGGSVFECRLDGGSFGVCSSPRVLSGLVAGSHVFQVRAIDPAGNVDPSPASYAWVVDLSAPETSINASDVGPPAAVKMRSASFSFSSPDATATFECSLDAGPWAVCASSRALSDLADGLHTFQVRAKDPAGNVDATPGSRTWTVDTTPPPTSVAPVASPTKSRSIALQFSSGEPGSTFRCRLDAGSYEACTSPKAYSDLPDGLHRFSVLAADPLGNENQIPAQMGWIVDTQSPTTTISSTIGEASAAFELSASEAVVGFQCRLDGAAWGTCFTRYDSLTVGPHRFEVRGTDTAGNIEDPPARFDWTIPTPDTTITSGPSGAVPDAGATFAFAANEPAATFTCSLDGAPPEPCRSPWGYTDLGDGAHTFSVRASGFLAGQPVADPTPATRAWTVDTIAPTVTITGGPSGAVARSDATFTVSPSEPGARVECRLDGGAWAACAGTVAYARLGSGVHRFDVRAIDATGNTGPEASRGWTVTALPGAAGSPRGRGRPRGNDERVATPESRERRPARSRPAHQLPGRLQRHGRRVRQRENGARAWAQGPLPGSPGGGRPCAARQEDVAVELGRPTHAQGLASAVGASCLRSAVARRDLGGRKAAKCRRCAQADDRAQHRSRCTTQPHVAALTRAQRARCGGARPSSLGRPNKHRHLRSEIR